MAKDPYYSRCARQGADCHGRITWEHAMYFSGRKIQDRWAIIPLCWYHHLGSGLNKRINEFLALRRASEADLAKYPKSNFKQMRTYLEKQYGTTHT